MCQSTAQIDLILIMTHIACIALNEFATSFEQKNGGFKQTYDYIFFEVVNDTFKSN